jgi:hypothetical protein
LLMNNTIQQMILRIVDLNECNMEPCENNGTCHNNNGSYTCECMKGFQGQHCQDGKCLHVFI